MITQGNWENFLTLHGERLLLVKRKHKVVIVFPIAIISLLIALFFASESVVFTNLFPSTALLVVTGLLLICILLTSITKCIMDWYYHIYILTTRKILEVSYTPLYAHVVNDVLLDRVNCTEVDFQRNGILNELLDMGDVVLTFDRPTKQESFTFKNIKNSYKLGRFLTQQLIDRDVQDKTQTIWFKSPAQSIA